MSLAWTMALLTVTGLMAQPAMPGLSSSSYPMVNPDLTVTFTLNAPKADTVELRFGSMGRFPFVKDDKGIWTVTIGPLEPALYKYALVVDGLRIVDPQNPELQGGTAPGFNLLNVPGDPLQAAWPGCGIRDLSGLTRMDRMAPFFGGFSAQIVP